MARHPALWWLTLFEITHREGPSGFELWTWPDARPVLKQPYLVHQVFGMIRAEVRLALRAEHERMRR